MMSRATRSSFPESPIMDGSPRTVTNTIMGRSPRGGTGKQRRSYSLEQLWPTSGGGGGSGSGGASQSYYGCTQLGIQISDITVLLQEVIPKFASRKNKELVRLSKSHFQRIISQISAAAAASETTNTTGVDSSTRRDGGNGWSGPDATELEDIVSVLTQFLDSVPDLPPSLVASVHTTIGLIRQKQRFYDSSIESLQKALWIKNSARECPEEIAIALHRLGLAYGRKGEKSLASSVLQRAIRKYEDDAHWSKNHPLVVMAKGQAERYAAGGQGRQKGSSRSPVPPPSTSRNLVPPSSSSSSSSSGVRRRATAHSPATRNVLAASSKDWSSLPAIPNLR